MAWLQSQAIKDSGEMLFPPLSLSLITWSDLQESKFGGQLRLETPKVYGNLFASYRGIAFGSHQNRSCEICLLVVYVYTGFFVQSFQWLIRVSNQLPSCGWFGLRRQSDSPGFMLSPTFRGCDLFASMNSLRLSPSFDG